MTDTRCALQLVLRGDPRSVAFAKFATLESLPGMRADCCAGAPRAFVGDVPQSGLLLRRCGRRCMSCASMVTLGVVVSARTALSPVVYVAR